MKAKVNKIDIEIMQGNILNLPVQAVVIVTDPNLSIDPTLLNITGPLVQAQTRAIGWCDVGQAAITDAGNLKNIRKIIHAVGPRWGEGSERGKLTNVTWECLTLAENSELDSIALPAISVGTLGYPLENCAKIMLTRIIDFTFEKVKHLQSVILCLEDITALEVFKAEFERQIYDLRQTGEGKVRV